MGIRSDLFTVYLYNINLADSGAEKHVRKIIDNGKFTFENEEYVVIQNSKPSHETKTDFYILAKKSTNEETREFKISYKKPDFSFVENKVKPHRISFIYQGNWKKILLNQMNQIKSKFNDQTLIDFSNQTIKLGWRYEIEQSNAPGIGNRTLSQEIKENISSQVLWGKGCSDVMRDALVDGKQIQNSGIPDYILIKSPKKIKVPNDVFSDLVDIKEYANANKKMRAGFITQNYRWNDESSWKTEGFSRSFTAWVKWSVKNKKLIGKIILDKPFEKTAGDVIENLNNCFDQMDIPYASNFSFESLKGRIGKNVVTRL